MKRISAYFLGVLCIAAASGFSQDTLPNQFELLKENYERAIERANRPITSKYVQELKAMKARMVQAGNLQLANQIDKELTQLGAVPKTLAEHLKANTWNYPIDGKITKVIFNENGTAQFSGYRNYTTKWQLKDHKTVSITFADKRTAHFTFDDFSNLQSETKLKGSGMRYLKVYRGQ